MSGLRCCFSHLIDLLRQHFGTQREALFLRPRLRAELEVLLRECIVARLKILQGCGACIAGKPIEYVVVTDDDMYAYFDSLGIPREAVDDNVVEGVPWSSDDMVSFERTIREGKFAVISDDVRKLTGHAPQSLLSFAMEHRAMLAAQ